MQPSQLYEELIYVKLRWSLEAINSSIPWRAEQLQTELQYNEYIHVAWPCLSFLPTFSRYIGTPWGTCSLPLL